jgi:hypothetical protein
MNEDDFIEDKHTAQEIADFYNQQKYTPDDISCVVAQLPTGEWVPQANPAFMKDLYWCNNMHQWVVFPR